MPERSSKKKARRESITSSIDEPECSSMRTENIPSISDKDFADLSEKIEKSMSKRIKDTETGQREILERIENLTSKNDSLADRTSHNASLGSNGTRPENVVPETRPIGLNEFRQDVSQHIRTLSYQHECNCLWRKYSSWYSTLAESFRESPRNSVTGVSGIPKKTLNCYYFY